MEVFDADQEVAGEETSRAGSEGKLDRLDTNIDQDWPGLRTEVDEMYRSTRRTLWMAFGPLKVRWILLRSL